MYICEDKGLLYISRWRQAFRIPLYIYYESSDAYGMNGRNVGYS